ncbi:hypothetical protein BHK69_30380 (plasmid) [Bosea vaviloviae]|uniref:Uncharacterized protein n=1 Tax=Bosea vaviloviae TaxID=1526658 RepID=A0A1D7UCD3_9HYPH|nr:hypothetical protein BHK69_30380 [Bosea vaviloviae]
MQNKELQHRAEYDVRSDAVATTIGSNGPEERRMQSNVGSVSGSASGSGSDGVEHALDRARRIRAIVDASSCNLDGRV